MVAGDSSEAWSPAADERLRELAELGRSSVDFAENFRKSQGGLPADHAPIRAASGEAYGESTLMAYDFSTSYLVVAEDVLRGFAILLGPPPETSFAPQVLVRAALESAARSWHLAGADEDPALLAGRAINEQIYNTRENMAMARNPSPEHAERSAAVLKEGEELLDQFFTTAAEEGLRIVLDRQGRPRWVEEERPNATWVVTAAWEKAHPGLGDFLYRFYSATSHARPTAFRMSLNLEEDENGRLRGHTYVSLKHIEMWTKVIVTAWADAFARVVRIAGWDEQLWRGWYVKVQRNLQGIKLRLPPTE